MVGGLTTVTDLLGRDFTYAYDGRNAVTALAMPRNIENRWRYTLDGLVRRDSVLRRDPATLRLVRDSRGAPARVFAVSRSHVGWAAGEVAVQRWRLPCYPARLPGGLYTA
jgi:hypothetical protein